MIRSSRMWVGAVVLGMAGCGGGDAEPAADAETAAPAAIVRILEPADGATVGPDVTVRVEAEGIEIAPAADAIPGTGHHHFYLDRDVASWTMVIPADDPQIVHKGDGTSEHTFTGLAPGEHRIITVIANPAHIPIDPPAADTVTFMVGG